MALTVAERVVGRESVLKSYTTKEEIDDDVHAQDSMSAIGDADLPFPAEPACNLPLTTSSLRRSGIKG